VNKLAGEPDASRLGNPSFVWRFGQWRRLQKIQAYVNIRGAQVLDLGCGVGEYVRAIRDLNAICVGIDLEIGRLNEAQKREKKSRLDNRSSASFIAAASERLPLKGNCFDLVLLNEVIEHVDDDSLTLEEVARVLKIGGYCILFAPNRGYPFETHGIWWRGKYIFGNIPLVNWLPTRLRNRLVPHARIYSHHGFENLVNKRLFEIVEHTYVFPGFDNVFARSRLIGSLLRKICYSLETTYFKRLGISHLLVLRRIDRRDAFQSY